MPARVVDSSSRMPESVSEPAPRRVPARVVDSSSRMPESVSDPASRKMPARVADSSRKMPAPVSTSSALLVETGSVAIKIAKGHDTSNLYTVTTVQQSIEINAKGYIPTTESLAAALQSTMTTTTTRQPVIIPGTRKRVGSVAQTGKLSKSQHLSPLLRHGLPLGAITAFILFSLFSLSSLADGYTQVPVVGNAI